MRDVRRAMVRQVRHGRTRVEHGLVGALIVVVVVALFDALSAPIGAIAREVLRIF
jgi:Flp pilus assembly pilin Flp